MATALTIALRAAVRTEDVAIGTSSVSSPTFRLAVLGRHNPPTPAASCHRIASLSGIRLPCRSFSGDASASLGYRLRALTVAANREEPDHLPHRGDGAITERRRPGNQTNAATKPKRNAIRTCVRFGAAARIPLGTPNHLR